MTREGASHLGQGDRSRTLSKGFATTARLPRLTELPEPETPAWLPRVAGTVHVDVQHSPGLPRTRDLPSPTRRRAPSTGLMIEQGIHGSTLDHNTLFAKDTLTPEAAYSLPFAKARRLKAILDGPAVVDGGPPSPTQTHATVFSASARFSLPKRPIALPGALVKRSKPPTDPAAPLESPPSAAHGPPGDTADSAFVSDPLSAHAHRAALESHAAQGDGDDVVPGVETDDDVVQFYARYGQDSEMSKRVKFFYCVPAGSGLDYRPYDLRVVRRSEVGDVYFTMSATGVMKIYRGQQSEFMSLAQWVREKTHFRIWRRTPFFRNNTVAQMFQRWSMTVRRHKFLRKRAALQKRLFLAQPTFCAPLLKILEILDGIRSLDLARLSPPSSKDAKPLAALDTTPSKNSGPNSAGTDLRSYMPG